VAAIHSGGRVTAMIRVVAGIIERDGRVLICRRRTDAILGGKWEFPGGKMRPSETPRQALDRELREELGVAPESGDLIQIVRHRYSEMREPVQILFLSAAINDMPKNHAFERIVWAPRTELPRYDFLAADRLVISRLVRGEIWSRLQSALRRAHSGRDGRAAIDNEHLAGDKCGAY
jgi:8-oxo-dGTP diphosphatase